MQAAETLFRNHGFARTTTQQVAEAADVAAGTVFRYVESKQELLLMVINERLAPALSRAIGSVPEARVEDQVLALLDPYLQLAREQPENASPFLQEVLFGADGPHRQASLTMVERTVGAIAKVLARAEPMLPEGLGLLEAARWVFSALVTELLRAVLSSSELDTQVLRARVSILMRGLGVAP